MLTDPQRQLVECAAAITGLQLERSLVARRVTATVDGEARAVLAAIVRRWTDRTGPRFESRAVAAGLGPIELDHVVPCQTLVDRMINDPSECEALLTTSNVTARLTRTEHLSIERPGLEGIELYQQRLIAPVEELLELGLRRYRRAGIEVILLTHTPPMF